MEMEEDKTENAENTRKKYTVKSMSKKVATWIIAILIGLFIVDLIRSSQAGTSPWISRYMEVHYPGVLDALSDGNSSDSMAATEEAAAVETGVSVEKAESDSVFDADGFIFPDSADEYLTEDELYELKYDEEYSFEDLLGFARNEIYARHGFPFKEGGRYFNHYIQYDWYNELEHNDVSDGELNEFEHANVDLIANIETREGFR